MKRCEELWPKGDLEEEKCQLAKGHDGPHYYYGYNAHFQFTCGIVWFKKRKDEP